MPRSHGKEIIPVQTVEKKCFYSEVSLIELMPSVKDIMSKNVITIEFDKTVFEAAELMNSKRNRLPCYCRRRSARWNGYGTGYRTKNRRQEVALRR